MTTSFDLSSSAVRSNLAYVNGELVLIRLVNGGWTTVVDAAGAESKQRNKAVVRLTEEQLALLSPAEAAPRVKLTESTDAKNARLARKARNSQFQKGQSVFECRVCGRKTRQTGNGDNEHVGLCEDCYEMAGLHNRVQDGGVLTEAEKQECLKRCSFVASKGGTPDSDHADMCGWVAGEAPAVVGAIAAAYKQKMHKERLTLDGGVKKVAQDCNDAVAAELRTLTLDAVYHKVAAKLMTFKHKKVASSGTPNIVAIAADLRLMYAHLNPGMQRMNLGNLYRTATKVVAQ